MGAAVLEGMDSNCYELGASALTALERWQDVVSSNIAMNAPGGKQGIVGMEVSFEGAMKGPEAVVSRDFSAGAIVGTGNPTDVAIRGSKGFFGVGGGANFTRDGEFHWSPEHVLVNKAGVPVDGESGNITKSANGGDVAIDVRGNVFQGGAKIGKLAVYDIDGSDLRGASGKFHLMEGMGEPGKLENYEVAGGFVEKPNGSKVGWMTDLVKLKHSQEAVGKMIGSIDELYARAARYAGE